MGAVCLLNDNVGSGECTLNISVFDEIAGLNVVISPDHSLPLKRFLHRKDGRKLLQFGVKRGQSFLQRAFVRCGDEGDRLTDIRDLSVRKYRIVVLYHVYFIRAGQVARGYDSNSGPVESVVANYALQYGARGLAPEGTTHPRLCAWKIGHVTGAAGHFSEGVVSWHTGANHVQPFSHWHAASLKQRMCMKRAPGAG